MGDAATVGRLTPLQVRVLETLARVSPPWSLTGGAALAGFHLRHRTTRDLDLFWHGQAMLGVEVDRCTEALASAGLQTDILERAPAFVRIRVATAEETVIVDLVAKPVPVGYAADTLRLGAHTIRVDSAPEILANKLGTLLHRAEIRDLIDIEGLLGQGHSLEAALRVAARKDGGFSPVTLGWMLESFPLRQQAHVTGMPPEQVAALDAFRIQLSRDVAGHARP